MALAIILASLQPRRLVGKIASPKITPAKPTSREPEPVLMSVLAGAAPCCLHGDCLFHPETGMPPRMPPLDVEDCLLKSLCYSEWTGNFLYAGH